VLHFIGTAQLAVQSGAAWVAGRVVTSETGAVSICADARVGGPLAIEASNVGVQIPRSGSQITAITLRSQDASPPDASATGPEHVSAGGTAAAQRKHWQEPARPFQVTQQMAAGPAAQAAAQGAAAAPDYCHEWRQAAAELAARQAAAAAPIVAIVGSKQTGKSTFARLLVNSLLNTWPMVAYLDTDCGQSEFTAPGKLIAWETGLCCVI